MEAGKIIEPVVLSTLSHGHSSSSPTHSSQGHAHGGHQATGRMSTKDALIDLIGGTIGKFTITTLRYNLIV